jgi:hypothetical protein
MSNIHKKAPVYIVSPAGNVVKQGRAAPLKAGWRLAVAADFKPKAVAPKAKPVASV